MARGWPWVECPWCDGELNQDDISDALYDLDEFEMMDICPHCGEDIYIVWGDGEAEPNVSKQREG